VPLLIALSLANGAVSAVSLPAASALTPETVPVSLLAPANAVVRIGANIGRFTGTTLGGVLVAATGSGWAIVANALLFLCAALATGGSAAPRGQHHAGPVPWPNSPRAGGNCPHIPGCG
jgi:MFS family permease